VTRAKLGEITVEYFC